MRKELERIARAVVWSVAPRKASRPMRVSPLADRSVALFILPSAEMRSLKERFFYAKKQKKSPLPSNLYPLTSAPFVDVLAFPDTDSFPRPEGGSPSLGEIYINKLLLKGPRKVLVHRVIHGALHLLGYDHMKKRDTIRMEKLERELMRDWENKLLGN